MADVLRGASSQWGAGSAARARLSIITIAFADTLAAGGNLARAVCVFFALSWTLRLIAGTWVFDMRPYLTNRYRRLGYRAINIVFA